MENQKLVDLLRSDHDCDTCGFVNCKHDICLMDAMAADAIENLQNENAAIRRMIDNLTSAQAVMVNEFTEKLEELEQVKAERDAAVTDIAKIARGGKTWMCPYCKHGRETGYGFADCDIQLGGCKVPFTRFKWRGPQKEA